MTTNEEHQQAAPPPNEANLASAASSSAIIATNSGPQERIQSAPPPTSTTSETPAPTIRRTPFPHLSSKSTSPPRAALTSDQIEKYNVVLNAVSSWTTIPTTSAAKSPVEPITASERMWLTRECILRYLRAAKWSTADAINRLLSTLTWRREYGVVNFTPDYISPENETGKQTIMGYDIEGRPCHYLNPSKQNTKRSDRQLHHLVFMMERAIDLMGPGQETLALLISFRQTSSGQGASLAQGRETMSILQNHYPERLGRALVTDIPWFFNAFFKLINPFIDPLTRQKLKFNEPMKNHVPSEQLLKSHGGEVEFEYVHDVYWPALNNMAAERRNAFVDRWVKAGSKVGESEVYLRGGDESPVGGAETGSQVDGVDEMTEKITGLRTTEEYKKEEVPVQ